METVNLFEHNFIIDKEFRASAKRQVATTIWFTGLSAAGKSTIANILESKLAKLNKHTYVLDGDQLRFGLCYDLDFSQQGREENIRRAGEVAKILTDAGLLVMCCFITPFQKDRDFLRALFNKGEFIEIYVDAPLQLCKKRDPKGLYAKAESGSIKNFTGIDSPFEIPENPELVLKTVDFTADELADHIIIYLLSKGII